ncbi:hypothetical protein RHMOL_Rhmol04G0034100 [Rhododendron molle]|uniref:Uncharacterized protein n=1 Tax=Rhododendron molle TaxID=49168 RepID=A0ACC0NWP0_RHOML|nr:hypothetical protein RHMOL_Rhmol04G0034100 [Rhododendron molle]
MGIWDLINKLRSASRTAVEENVVPVVDEYVHDEEGRARIARRATSFARKAAGHVFRVGLTWVPGGTLMYDIWEVLKDEPPLPNSNENKKSKTVAVEEMQAKTEKMQEEMDTAITQQSKMLMEKMQQEMNTVKQEMDTAITQQSKILTEKMQQEMDTVKQEMDTTITQQSKILMEEMQQEVNTVKQEMNTLKQEMNTIRSRL